MQVGTRRLGPETLLHGAGGAHAGESWGWGGRFSFVSKGKHETEVKVYTDPLEISHPL